MDATTYLLSSKANAKRLREAIDELNSGRGDEHILVEPNEAPPTDLPSDNPRDLPPR